MIKFRVLHWSGGYLEIYNNYGGFNQVVQVITDYVTEITSIQGVAGSSKIEEMDSQYCWASFHTLHPFAAVAYIVVSAAGAVVAWLVVHKLSLRAEVASIIKLLGILRGAIRCCFGTVVDCAGMPLGASDIAVGRYNVLSHSACHWR